MAINAKQSKNRGNSEPVEPVEAGTYPARLVGVVDLGLQAQRPFQGEEKPPAYSILTIYELSDEFLKDEDGEDIPDKPRWQSESFPLYSLDSERAKSTHRYKAVDPAGVHDGDWGECIGAPVMVTLVHNPNKKGGVYVNIASTAPMRAKDAAKLPELVNEPLVFDTDAPDLDVFNRLPKWVQEKVKENLEFEGSPLQKLLGASPKKEEKTKTTKAPVDEDDEAPY